MHPSFYAKYEKLCEYKDSMYIYVVLFATIWKESMTCKKSCDTLFCDIRKIIPALTYKWRTKSWGKINTNIIGHRCAFFDKFKSF